jgi:hypothetical protein
MEKRNPFEQLSQHNIKYVVDSQGHGWICNGDAIAEGDLSGQGCVRADEWHYDRMFGG